MNKYDISTKWNTMQLYKNEDMFYILIYEKNTMIYNY